MFLSYGFLLDPIPYYPWACLATIDPWRWAVATRVADECSPPVPRATGPG